MTTHTPEISAALARLWAKFLPEIEGRVALVGAAAAALAAGELTASQRTAGEQAAHKLAGSLGTFGLLRGTELARRAELALAEEPVAASAEELAAWVAEIEGLIQGRS